MNNRLDYINNFKDGAIESMTALRHKFIDLDEELRQILYIATHTLTPEAALARAVSLARTNLEQALQYAIKSLCLKYESKDTEEKE